MPAHRFLTERVDRHSIAAKQNLDLKRKLGRPEQPLILHDIHIGVGYIQAMSLGFYIPTVRSWKTMSKQSRNFFFEMIATTVLAFVSLCTGTVVHASSTKYTRKKPVLKGNQNQSSKPLGELVAAHGIRLGRLTPTTLHSWASRCGMG